MIRERKFRQGNKVKLSKMAVSQSQFESNHKLYKAIFEEKRIGEIIRIEEMLPGNSNFRYSVRFGNDVLTINEVLLENA
jgi:hypothetical protein